MRRSIIAGLMLSVIVFSVFLSACGGDDSEDQAQQQNAQDALKNLDLENQANRANQTIPNMPPQVTILAPSPGTIYTSSPVEISWTASDQNNDKLMVGIGYRQVIEGDQSTPVYNIVMSPTAPDPKNFTFDISQLQKPADYEIRVLATDGALSNVAFTRFRYQ